MSMRKVAQLAGVSISTVSRVVNAHPNITPETARNVRAAMEKLEFRPAIRRSGTRAKVTGSQTLTAALVMFGPGRQTAPAFEQLLQGISEAADASRLNVSFSFVDDPSKIPPRLAETNVDGLLLGGVRPDPAVQQHLERLPSVWLMGNRQRPRWGDQVMPDNTAIAQIAAEYLTKRGHRELVCLMCADSGWSIDLRALAFHEAARQRGANAHVIKVVEPPAASEWSPNGLATVAAQMVDLFVVLKPRATGLFISEDRLVSAIDREFVRRGIDAGVGRGLDVISCNNERQYLAGLQMRPASIDINAASIGRRAVELLMTRIQVRENDGRTRVMVGPRLVAE